MSGISFTGNSKLSTGRQLSQPNIIIMKFLVLSMLVAVAQCAPQFGQFGANTGGAVVKEVKTTTVQVSQQPAVHNVYHAGGSASEVATHSQRLLAQSQQAHHVESKDARAEITEHSFDMPEPGRYTYHFKTNNGIEMVEAQDAVVKKGSFAFVAPDGQTYRVEYVADEMGFHPVGPHLPVAHPIPEAIMRSLEYNAQHPEEEKECVDCQ